MLKTPHPAHRHTGEAILVILAGHGYPIVDEKRLDWKAGDIIAIPAMVWHQHFNTDSKEPARFLAIHNAPILDLLGLRKLELMNE